MASVHDFPQLWQRPPFESLLACLESLELTPPIWNHNRRRDDIISEQEASFSHRRDVALYLSGIVKSSLSWISDDEDKETLWELASRPMGEITRRWPFATDTAQPFELIIKEPALTGDSIGFKTWGSSYLLALHLDTLASTFLFRLFDESLGEPRPRVLELGSGTGLLGLAAAATWRTHVMMSDLPGIVPNLAANAEANAKMLEGLGGSVEVGALTWGGEGEDEIDLTLFGTPNQFKIILVADPLYDDNHPELLHSAILTQLALGTEARAIVMVPKRDQTTIGLLDSFKALMTQGEPPLECLEQGELEGEDDWDANDDEEVKCWWGIFARRQA
ncbi:hypothetical protein SAPIO_CDS1402 [Scedosporium apiospermum]|uniref:Rapid response to glucose protein 1 n=1 Tax=Pseudallescheria apiosperma TaxID=563466 RepID=A0A084GF87_PSEDA|nr:uncharacterized protein SAPIO_CDS1402 [Scedosporium apiospermum]KEZ45999.1 hypothetical protein SAPIO_CDS1402 [Scedosporium apiospermum]